MQLQLAWSVGRLVSRLVVRVLFVAVSVVHLQQSALSVA